MRKRFKRSKRKEISTIHPSGDGVEKIARNVKYDGSVEHKSYPIGGAAPRLRADATKCPPKYKGREPELTHALQAAFRSGAVSTSTEEGFPRYIWLRLDGVLYEARHMRGPSGSYKAYALEESTEHPDDPFSRIGSFEVAP